MANPGVNANINLLVSKKCCAIKKDSYSIPINNINSVLNSIILVFIIYMMYIPF